MKEEVTSINKYIKPEPESGEEKDEETRRHKHKRRIDEYGPLASEWRIKMLERDPEVDTSFAIRFHNGNTAMGNKAVKIVGDDLIVGNERYEGTRGLWNLITGTEEDQLADSTLKDMDNYIKLLWVTSVLHHDFDRNNRHPRANGSWKWKNKLKPIWNESKHIPSPEEVGADEISGNGVFIQNTVIKHTRLKVKDYF